MNTLMFSDDWQELVGFLPQNWVQLAREHGALKGLRKNKSPKDLLRTMLLHCACGYSLRETAVRAKVAGLADMSDVALMKRLKKCGPWFKALCIALLNERGMDTSGLADMKFRAFDATHVKEPGQTGSQWRIHYSVALPDLDCDFFSITPAKGKGNGESLCNFPVAEGDCILADRGYCNGAGLAYVASQKAEVIVRLQPGKVLLRGANGEDFDLIKELRSLTRPGQVGEWEVSLRGKATPPVQGRVCAMRKLPENAAYSRKKCLRKANKNGQKIREVTLFYSNYIILFSTLAKKHNAITILNYYRLRWQIELVFKRFKQLADFGHLPKYDDESSRAWLYGKLFVALLVEKLLAYGGSISPWRDDCEDEEPSNNEPLERICFYVPPSADGNSTLPEAAVYSFRLA